MSQRKADGWTEQLFRKNKIVDWDFYFANLENDRENDRLYEMNKALIQHGRLALKGRSGKFGIINDGCDICQYSALNGNLGFGLYFQFHSDVFAYLAAAKKHGFCKQDAFVFQISANGKKETK